MMQPLLEVNILEDDDNYRFIYEEFLSHKFHLNFMGTIEEFREFDSQTTEKKCVIADLRLPDGSFFSNFMDKLDKSQHKFIIVSECYDLDIMRKMLKCRNVVDYLTKPINGCELSAKLEVLADSSFPSDADILNRAYGLLSNKERTILSTIAENPGRMIRKSELIKRVWNDTSVVAKTIDVHISNIRSKLNKLSLSILSEDQYLRVKL